MAHWPREPKSSEAGPEIIMTINQPVNSSKAKRDKPRTKNPTPHSRVQEAGSRQTPMSIVCPPSRVQHASIAACIPGQQPLQLPQSSPPWWSWSPPPNPWNWYVWSLGAFHQLTATHQPGQANPPTTTTNNSSVYIISSISHSSNSYTISKYNSTWINAARTNNIYRT